MTDDRRGEPTGADPDGWVDVAHPEAERSPFSIMPDNARGWEEYGFGSSDDDSGPSEVSGSERAGFGREEPNDE